MSTSLRLVVPSLLLALALPLAGCASELPGAKIAIAGTGSMSSTDPAPVPHGERSVQEPRVREVLPRQTAARYYEPRGHELVTCRQCGAR